MTGDSGHSLLSGTPRVYRNAHAHYGEIESHQFQVDENEVWRHHQLQRHFEDKGQWWTFSKYREVRKWTSTLLTGFWIGVVALFVSYFTKLITGFKYESFRYMIEMEKDGSLMYGVGFLFLIVYNIGCALIAHLFVRLEPLAAGSGIPEVKCFLNGLNIPRIVNMKTLVCKTIGIIFSCSAGLALGKEGPMIHIGAVVAAIVSQGRSNMLGIDTAFSKNQDFRNDKERRDFVACGSGAGVAAAFGAPIGGVLFSLEEGASFWTVKLIWRCFFCTMATVGSVYFLSSFRNTLGHSDNAAMFSFGEFFSLEGEKSNYSMWEFSMFMLVGSMGGMIGAHFNALSMKLNKWRKEYVYKYVNKLGEVVLVTALMSLISIILPLLWTRCTPLPVDMKGWSAQEKNLVTELNPLYCPAETHYNELASLYLTDSDGAIRQLFHFREVGDHKVSAFGTGSLFLFFVPYVYMACITSGVAVPAGMFVPSLLSGAGFGRLVGHILHKLDRNGGSFADSGTYALMGSAAVTGGITRITISLTLMILEATGDMQYVLPLMLTVTAAFLVGNIFTKSIYEQHIETRDLHLLEEEESLSEVAQFYDWTVSDVMTKDPISVRPVVRVGEIYDILRQCPHNCFPVIVQDGEASRGATSDNRQAVDRPREVFCGTVLRKVISTLIKHKAFAPPESDPNSVERISPLVNWGTLECIYPNYPDVRELDISSRDRLCWLDLRPYIDTAAFTISGTATLNRTYQTFRTLGLRHLCVVGHGSTLIGIITRADLMHLSEEHSDEHKGERDEEGYAMSPLHEVRNGLPRRRVGTYDHLQSSIDLELNDDL